MEYNLKRFLTAQQFAYTNALREIKNGRKTSHWMWFIFPQLTGLGYSEMAQYYAIRNFQEAEAYLSHPVLGKRLVEITQALLKTRTNNATQLMGSPDDLKLHSCLTLFSILPNANPVFEQALTKFFDAQKDIETLELIGELKA